MNWLEKKNLLQRKRITRRELFSLPSFVTYLRILLIPVVVLLMMTVNDLDGKFHAWDVTASVVAAFLFGFASLSDYFDGYLARRYNFNSSYGKFIDPLADKLLTLAVLILLVEMSRVPAWVVILLLAREITITSLRAIAADDGVVMAASQWGKYKTFLSSFALGFLIWHYPFWVFNMNGIGEWLLLLTFIISMGSGAHYLYTFFARAMEKEEEKSD